MTVKALDHGKLLKEGKNVILPDPVMKVLTYLSLFAFLGTSRLYR